MIAIIDCGDTRSCDISRIAGELGYENEVFLMKDLLNKKWLCLPDLENFNGIIFSGSPITLTCEDKKTCEDRNEYLELFPFIKEIHTPVLGICFGHQVIGHSFGSHYHVGEFINGKRQVEVVSPNILFEWITDLTFHQNHEQHITLPDDFMLLAKSDTCENESMKHKDKDIYGVQFHPEVSGDSGKKLIQNFLNICR